MSRHQTGNSWLERLKDEEVLVCNEYIATTTLILAIFQTRCERRKEEIRRTETFY